MKQTIEALGPIDHVVHAAAISSGKFGFPFTNLQPADWIAVFRVNVMGMTNIAHVLSPHLIERGRGTFVFVASIAGQIGSQTDPPYSASKAANINFAQCMAKDLRRTRNSRQHRLPGNGADASQSFGLAGVARSSGSRRSIELRGMVAAKNSFTGSTREMADAGGDR